MENLSSFIKWSLLELATNNKLDHRGYCQRDKKMESLLVNKIKNCSQDFDAGIVDVCEAVLMNPKIYKMFRRLQKKHKEEEGGSKQEEDDNDEDDDDDDDELHHLKEYFFYEIVRFIGLYEIESLHGDDCDKFNRAFYNFLSN